MLLVDLGELAIRVTKDPASATAEPTSPALGQHGAAEYCTDIEFTQHISAAVCKVSCRCC